MSRRGALRRLAGRAARRLRAIAAGSRAPLLHSDLDRAVGPEPLAVDGQFVTQRLYDRLTDEDVREVEVRAADAPELHGQPPIGDDLNARRWLVLNYGMWLNIPPVIERTGLIPGQPPDHIHAMARGPLAAAGGLGEADMVLAALRTVGRSLGAGDDGLDFGCSSGRVVRVLAAAFPEVRWRGCDPNAPAIGWAQEHLGTINFFVSPQQPPLPIADGDLTLVYAISIWSHFAPELGLRWFEEMHRVLRPGGLLVFTTHGLQSVSFYVQSKQRSPEQGREILDSLYRRGSWYAPEFGSRGDSGILNPEWGTAFLNAEWILARLCPRWSVLEFAPGRNQDNQDLYVLQRV
jgi:SAM-dependent methyltransferase